MGSCQSNLASTIQLQARWLDNLIRGQVSVVRKELPSAYLPLSTYPESHPELAVSLSWEEAR